MQFVVGCTQPQLCGRHATIQEHACLVFKLSFYSCSVAFHTGSGGLGSGYTGFGSTELQKVLKTCSGM